MDTFNFKIPNSDNFHLENSVNSDMYQNNTINNNGNTCNNANNFISEKKYDTTSSFFATFIDGSSFRNMIEYLRLPSIEGVFRFSKHKIVYEQGDKDNNILNVAELKTYELTDYDFISKSDEIVVGVNLCEIRNVCRNVGKKDHIDIYKLSNEPRNLYIRIRSQSEKGSESNLYLLGIASTYYHVYTIPQYIIKTKKNPTCTIYQTDFSKMCKSLSTIKCSHAMVHGFEKGVVFKGILSSGKIGSVKEYGKCSANIEKPVKSILNDNKLNNIIKSKKPPPKLQVGEIGEVERFKIDIAVIKYLIKLNALSSTGTIKIYVEKDLPLKMVCNIGTFGKMTIYLMG